MAATGNTKYDENDLVRLPEPLRQTILQIIQEYDREDRLDREAKKPLWIKLENYFNGIQRIYYDMVARDWKSIDPDNLESNRHYDKVINIYRAHAESIIAALSVKPPSAIFYPDDADVEEDVTTAKAAVKIKERIEKFNQAQLLIIKCLMILFNQGTVAAYIYNRRSSNYGSYSTPKYGDNIKVTTVLLNCSECGSNIDEIPFKGDERGKIPEESKKCPVCDFQGVPNQEEYTEEIPDIIGSYLSPKARTQIDIYSPLYAHMPFYARRAEDMPYMRLKFEQHYAALKNLYPKLKKRGFTASVDQRDSEDRGIAIGLNAANLSTVECWWIRDWGFDIIDGKDSEIKDLKKRFPDGCYAVVIDGLLVEIHNESLDDHWAISNNPLSNFIHSDPLGKPLAPIQDLENEVIDLQIETFEHAIPETFARADVLDFKKYGKERAQPGMMYPVNPPAEGQSLSESFHSVKTATLSEESDLFLRRLDDKGQFVSSAFPSIYGGPATSGSKTAKEYTESRAMALQRLSIPWNIVKYLWADVMGKAVPLTIHAMKETGEDEKVVEKTDSGFINNWIRQTDLDGKIGAIEADADESLPMSPAQLKDTIMQLLTLKDPFISEAMYHPQNTPLITKALGSPDFYIPGADIRDKQFAEFGDLLAGVAVEVKDYEDHGIEIETCLSFIYSATGRMLKKSNPQGIALIEEHMNLHVAALQAKSTKQGPAPEEIAVEDIGHEELPPNVAKFPAQ